MSKEQDFHKLIEQQDTERKKNIWRRIDSQIGLEIDEPVHNSDSTLALAKSLNLKKKNIMIMSMILLFAIVLIMITLILLPKVKYDGNKIRYCSDGDYYIQSSDLTVAQYADQNKLDILSFNWYDQLEFIENRQYRLNATDEVVCIHEDFFDINGVHTLYYVTDDKTEFEFLNIMADFCSVTANINSVEVKWSSGGFESYATFNYHGYKYYLKVEEALEQDYILYLISELFD